MDLGYYQGPLREGVLEILIKFSNARNSRIQCEYKYIWPTKRWASLFNRDQTKEFCENARILKNNYKKY